uniref:Palmitoyltransferase n=1 Tax=Saccoglossus kowalevskii TaxID=10224 RepID=A0ABM0MIR1_SACKO|nr:PREDICTED: palmitoyltransferase akr1-like [Saccoglossus kowalevskii]
MATAPGIGMMANLMEAVQNFGVSDCARIIQLHPETVNLIGWSGLTPIHKAALRGNLEIVQLLIANGAFINQPNNAGELPVHYACKRGSPMIIHLLYLVEVVGSSLNKRDNSGISALHLASQFGHFDTVRYLLKNQRSDVNWMDHAGNLALHLACTNGHSDIAWVLLQKGKIAQINQKNKAGDCPLNIARDGKSYRHAPLAKELAYWGSLRCQDHPPKGPLFSWYFLLLLPTIAFTFLILSCSYLGVYGNVVALFGIFFLTCLIGRQMHRLAHMSRWSNPVFFGAFAGGLFHTSVCYFYLVLPNILLYNVCLEQPYYAILTKDPGICRIPRRGPGKESPFMTIEHIATKELETEKYCIFCEMSLPDRTRHCKLCENCMVEMDHHCLFLLRCVAANTHRLFVCFIIVVMSVQITFLFSAVKYMQVSYEDMPLWDIPSTAFSEQVWLFTVCLVNIASIVWGTFLLRSQLEVISTGHTTVIRSQMNATKLLTFLDKLNNVCNFFRGLKTLTPEEICEMKATSLFENVHPL